MEKHISGKAFPDEIKQILRRIGAEVHPESEMDGVSGELYRYAEAYAMEKQLRNTAVALPVIRSRMVHAAEETASRFRNQNSHLAYYQHALSVCRMLIDLQMPIPAWEEDILLASTICHILPENIQLTDLSQELTVRYCLDPAVAETVGLIFWGDNEANSKQEQYYERVQQNKLALLMKLADRGNLVEQLYGISSWSARSYIHETRTYFLPMCIYAKEHYPALIGPVGVMMEKMRTLSDAAEILLSRYEVREAELTQQILTLREENATLKSLIGALQNGM